MASRLSPRSRIVIDARPQLRLTLGMIPRQLFCALLVTVSAFTARAEVRLHNLFTDHMVLQQGTTVPIWGWADEGERVTVEFAGQSASTTCKHGKWMVRLKNLKPGAPGMLKVSGVTNGDKGKIFHDSVQINDVVVGEVWIASGQSNMEFGMSGSFESLKDCTSSANPNIR